MSDLQELTNELLQSDDFRREYETLMSEMEEKAMDTEVLGDIFREDFEKAEAVGEEREKERMVTEMIRDQESAVKNHQNSV